MRKPSHASLKAKADRLFSAYIRNTGCCEWCGAVNDTIQTAHIFTRRYMSTRFDPINALCLCAKCHFRWHEQPVEGVEFAKSYLGEDIYAELRRKAQLEVKKVDLKEIISKLENHEEPYV